MRADWTKPDPLVTAYLASFGRYGVPFNAVYGPAAPQGIPLPELLTNGSVLGALGEASRTDGVARHDQSRGASAPPPVTGE
jgi:suppressor for copper-sensitivity B